VAAGDLADALADFRGAGRTLFSLGLVRGAEGNLSTWDGSRLRITRTGARLFELGAADVVEGSLQELPPGSSSDASLHVAMYRERGAGAIVHAHPPGTVPEGWVEGQDHGRYAHASTLEQSVQVLVAEARERVP
jgi:ribulose-5-phosphate 4-epimerase/fuculose-1-phosphate aldolase